MAESSEDAFDLLWAAIAGLRADVERLTGRLERMGEPGPGKAEETAEAWKAARQADIDRLEAERRSQGKPEELDEAEQEAFQREWINR